MCFGHSKSNGESEQMAFRGRTKAPLKRRRSPAEACRATPEDVRKLSKLDSAASTLANNLHSPFQKLSTPSKPGSPPVDDSIDNATTDTDYTSLPVKQIPSQAILHESTPLSPASTLRTSSMSDDASFEHRTAYVEAHSAPEESYSHIFQQFTRLQFYPALRFELKRSTKMGKSELAACFDLISKTSQQDYKSSSRGWDPDYKLEEMTHGDMMYLLVRQAKGYIGVEEAGTRQLDTDGSGAILGFLSFKFEPEDEEHDMMRPVQYIYEVHLDDRLRSQGLGACMIKWAEEQSRLVNISKMMLTVFTVNEGARRMYDREGFVRDALSPDDRVTRRKVIKADYIIMSKEL